MSTNRQNQIARRRAAIDDAAHHVVFGTLSEGQARETLREEGYPIGRRRFALACAMLSSEAQDDLGLEFFCGNDG